MKPVPDEHVEATPPRLGPKAAVAGKVRRQTDLRPGEVVQMTPGDLDRTGGVWVHRPESRKNRRRGHDRAVPLGPKARAALAPFLDGRPAEKPQL